MTENRRIVLDTETTGSTEDDRVIELGMVEMVGLQPTGREYLRRFNPEGREVHWGALKVHGIRNCDLLGEALFRDCLGEILDFIGSARVFIHNAAYDKRMIGFELAHAGQPHLMPRNISDTVTIAKKVWPGQKCGMDALMDRLMPGQRRGKHNALEDCRILSRLMPHFVPATDQEVDRLLNGGGRRLSASRQGWRQQTRQPAPAPAPAKPLKPVPAFGTGMKDGVAEAIARVRTAQDAAALRTFGQDGWSGIARAQLLEVLRPDMMSIPSSSRCHALRISMPMLLCAGSAGGSRLSFPWSGNAISWRKRWSGRRRRRSPWRLDCRPPAQARTGSLWPLNSRRLPA